MKSTITLTAVFVAMLGLVYVVRHRTTHAQTRISAIQVAAKVSTIQPFSIESASTVMSPAGASMPGERQIWAGDANRYLHRLTATNAKTGLTDLDKTEMIAGTTRTIYSSLTRSIMQVNQPADLMANFWAAQGDPGNNCLTSYSGLPMTANTEVDGTEIDNGVRLIRMKPSSNGTATTQMWLAPDFNCAPVKALYDWKGQGGRTILNIVSSSRGITDESLFAVPPNYEQLSPSDFYTREASATAAGQYGKAHGEAQFTDYLKYLKTRFKNDDEYWVSHRVP